MDITEKQARDIAARFLQPHVGVRKVAIDGNFAKLFLTGIQGRGKKTATAKLYDSQAKEGNGTGYILWFQYESATLSVPVKEDGSI